MADGKKNNPDTGKVDESLKPGMVESVKADPPVQDQPAPAKVEALKGKDAPAPAKEGSPLDKDEKQPPPIPGMGDPASAGKVVDFTAAQDEATKGKPPEKAAAQDKDKPKDAVKPRRAAYPRLTRRPLTRPSRNFGTKWPKANRRLRKVLPSKQRSDCNRAAI